MPFFWTKQYKTLLRMTGFAPSPDGIDLEGDPAGGDVLAFYRTSGRVLAVAGIGRDREVAAASEVLRASGPCAPDEMRDAIARLLEG